MCWSLLKKLPMLNDLHRFELVSLVQVSLQDVVRYISRIGRDSLTNRYYPFDDVQFFDVLPGIRPLRFIISLDL